jgi:hypothetical protein
MSHDVQKQEITTIQAEIPTGECGAVAVEAMRRGMSVAEFAGLCVLATVYGVMSPFAGRLFDGGSRDEKGQE